RVTGIELPVENVTWINAVQFCNELSKLNGLEEVYTITGVDAVADFSKNGWRLPTEAEWEYACKAGTNGDFAGSGIIGEMAWYGDNSGLKMHPPGRKNPNQFGLYDMHGNVWEWCWDYYDPDYYSEGMTIDPVGPSNGERRVLRGGSWNDGMNFLRSSNRTLPANIIGNNGIRPVRIK
ncbi:MAG: SUMF1/EgtB/PvdO family nonheme iron enzyme, partial [Candidatus Kapabacteria bacterium]|nr:SUMF1/EgtB/PvdO family nonheme iron enzyme [Candidatus Kapabacteria bacterium]